MNQEHRFVTYLQRLAENDDKAALAALRRGLGQPPGTVADTYRYVVPMLPADSFPGGWVERTHYLVASLFALHAESSADGNLGSHFAATVDPKADNHDAVERRFTALLTADPEDLHIYLRQGISFLKSNEAPVNWHQLMWDLLWLGQPDRAQRVQKRWATAFWRHKAMASSDTNTESSN